MLIATGLGTRRSTNWMRLEERTPAASRLVHFDLASQPMKHVNVHAVHELDQFSRKCLPKDVSASGGTTPWRAFQPEPEAGDLPFPTTRRGWVAGATEHEPSGAPSRHTPGGRLSAVGGESDAAGRKATARGVPRGCARRLMFRGSGDPPAPRRGTGRSPASGSGWKARQGVVPPLAETVVVETSACDAPAFVDSASPGRAPVSSSTQRLRPQVGRRPTTYRVRPCGVIHVRPPLRRREGTGLAELMCPLGKQVCPARTLFSSADRLDVAGNRADCRRPRRLSTRSAHSRGRWFGGVSWPGWCWS